MRQKKVEVTSSSSETVRPLQTPAPKKASMDKKSVILYEDFNNVPDGNTETIGKLGERYTDYIASRYYEPGRYIDNDYTPESGTWEGNFVFAGKGGTVILQAYNPQVPAAINTPLGDYSGDITVSVRCRYATAFWGASNDLGYVTTGGSTLTMAVFSNGYDSYDSAVTDIPYYSQMSTGQIYEPDGWQEITFRFRNESANASGYISFSTPGAIEIDWIKITDDNTFLACPVIHEATNFTNDGFTINWDQVRRSYNYFIDLWKTVYTAPSGINETCGFEEDKLPEWLAGDVEFVEGKGYNGSKGALISHDGVDGGLTTSDMGMKLHSFSSKVMFSADMGNIDNDHMLTIYYDVYGENGWEPFGYLAMDGWFTGPDYYYELDMSGPEFEDMFTAVRMYAENTDEDSMIYVDDLSIYSARPYVLERVGEIDNPENDDYAYNYYCYTDDDDRRATSYTFTGLDPETEYWYRVRSHNVREFSIGEKHHAFGVAAPRLLPATNISSSSYTANWEDAPKAQSYFVSNYTVTKIEEADPEHTLLSESFTRCEGEPDFSCMDPINNQEECFLDEYTDLKGWRGKNNYVGENMLGGGDYAGSYLVTPELMLNPNRGTALIYIEAQGYPGDYLQIQCLKGGFSGPVAFDEEGYLGGWLEIEPVAGEQINFASYYGMGFSLTGFDVAQAVEPGDLIRKFDSRMEVPAGEQACTFSNLDGGMYAYGIVSSYTLERQTAFSSSSNFTTVDTANGNSDVTNKIDLVDNSRKEVERYSIDGLKVNADYKGMVIVRMNDGTVGKKIAR